MSAMGSESCCSNSGALVVVAALPLCQAQLMFDDLDPCYLEESVFPVSRVNAPEIPFDVENLEEPFSESVFVPAPYRCACVMDCADAIALMQEVGHVEL